MRVAARPLEPITAISHPPTRVSDRNGGKHRPPKGQRQVRHQAQSGKGEPKNLLLHTRILAGNTSGSRLLRRTDSKVANP
jgi:hypothetical protein